MTAPTLEQLAPTPLADPNVLPDLSPGAIDYPPAPGVAAVPPNLVPVAFALAGAFLAWRALTSAHLLSEDPPAGRGLEIAEKAFKMTAPKWMKWAVPAIAKAYKLGATRHLSDDEINMLAAHYAGNLGAYIHQTSTEALLEGYTAGLNAGWQPQLAWVRASSAYGLDRPQMRAYIQSMMAKAAGLPMFSPDVVAPTARALMDKMLGLRANKLGHNEAWNAAQTGKVIAWMYGQSRGTIPATATKTWQTAEDEKVCPICGDLDGKAVPLADHFVTSNGAKLIAPLAHPNCRCIIRLTYPDLGGLVIKNMPGDPYNRDRHGEFAHAEQRSAPKGRFAKVTFAEPEQSTKNILDEIMSQPKADLGLDHHVDLGLDQRVDLGVGSGTDLGTGKVDLGLAPTKTGLGLTDLGMSNLGGRLGPSISPPVGVALDGQELSGSQFRLVKHINWVAGKPHEVIEGVWAESAHPSYHTEYAYMWAEQVFSGYALNKAPLPKNREGEIVDFDRAASQPDSPYKVGLLAFPAQGRTGMHHEEALNEALGQAQGEALAAAHENEYYQNMMKGRQEQARSEADEMFLSDADEYINYMSEPELDLVINNADPVRYAAGEYRDLDLEQMKILVSDRVNGFQPGWVDAYLDYQKDLGEPDFVNEADRMAEDSSIDVDYVPTIYVLDGWNGSYRAQTAGHGVSHALSGLQALPEGKYMITHVETRHPDEEDELPFKSYILATLKPVTEDELPHDVHKRLKLLVRN